MSNFRSAAVIIIIMMMITIMMVLMMMMMMMMIMIMILVEAEVLDDLPPEGGRQVALLHVVGDRLLYSSTEDF